MIEYEDILYLPHYELKYHPRMDIISRSAQFAPFAALTGYEELIEEKNNTKDKEKILGELEEEKINNCLKNIVNSNQKLLIEVSYYSIEESKLKKVKDYYKKINKELNSLVLNTVTIPINLIKDINLLI